MKKWTLFLEYLRGFFKTDVNYLTCITTGELSNLKDIIKIILENKFDFGAITAFNKIFKKVKLIKFPIFIESEDDLYFES